MFKDESDLNTIDVSRAGEMYLHLHTSAHQGSFFIMKNIKNKIIIIVSLLILIAFYVYPYVKKDKVVLAPEVNNKENVISSPELEKENIAIKNENISPSPQVEKKQEINKDVNEEIKASLIVDGKIYETNIEKDKSVYDLMNNVKSDVSKNFTFEGREFGGMGYFVDSINGVKGESGAYWIYYVNDKKAEIGVSQYVLKDKDVVEWKREGLMN